MLLLKHFRSPIFSLTILLLTAFQFTLTPVFSHEDSVTNSYTLYYGKGSEEQDLEPNAAEFLVMINYTQIIDILVIEGEEDFQAEFSEAELNSIGEYVSKNIQFTNNQNVCTLELIDKITEGDIVELAAANGVVPINFSLTCDEELGYMTIVNKLFIKDGEHQNNIINVMEGNEVLSFGAFMTEVTPYVEFNLKGEIPQEERADFEKTSINSMPVAAISFGLGLTLALVLVRLLPKLSISVKSSTTAPKKKAPAKSLAKSRRKVKSAPKKKKT